MSLTIWLETNLKNIIFKQNRGIPWNILFAMTLWQLWKAKNMKQFENMDPIPDTIATKSVNLAIEASHAFNNNGKRNGEKSNALINWRFPFACRIKINTYGSSVDHGWGSYGGLVRDDQGRWLEGFCGRISSTNASRLSFGALELG